MHAVVGLHATRELSTARSVQPALRAFGGGEAGADDTVLKALPRSCESPDARVLILLNVRQALR